MLLKTAEILLAAFLLLPVYWALHRLYFHNQKKSCLYYLFAVYLCAVYLFVGLPTVFFLRFELTLELIPFLPMAEDLKNTLLNVLLFVPLGMFLPFLWRKYRAAKATAAFGFGMSLAIETAQLFTYRATDVNDLIANTAGAILGYLLFCVGSLFAPGITKTAGRKNEVLSVLLTVLPIMFFLQPWLADLFYRIT